MICSRIGTLLKISENSFKNDQGEEQKFYKVTVLDDDAVVDEHSTETYIMKPDCAVKFLDKPDLIGKKVVLQGRILSQFVKAEKAWIKKFKVEDMKLSA